MLAGCPSHEPAPPVDAGTSGVVVAPLRTWTGDEPFDEAGRGLDIGDQDGDGRAEIVIGSPSTFVYGPDAVRSHAGVYVV